MRSTRKRYPQKSLLSCFRVGDSLSFSIKPNFLWVLNNNFISCIFFDTTSKNEFIYYSKIPKLWWIFFFINSWKIFWNSVKNHPKFHIWIFQFWHFPQIFVQWKVTCLVTLFDRKTRQNEKCKRSSLRSQCWMRHFCVIFKLV